MTVRTPTPSSVAHTLPIPTWEEVLKRNSIERMKREKFPLDIIHELPELIEKGYEAVPEEDIVRLNWWGLTHDKPKVGTFMVRVKVPGGHLRPGQLRALGRISQQFGRGYAELTTRQGIQFHWVRLDQLPEVLEAIQGAGLTTVGGEGDTVRNITGCPVSGISRDELFEVQPIIEDVARFFYGNRDYSNLPRKHKYSIAACRFQCNAPEIHDVALVGVIKEGRPGFAVRVGGGLSITPRVARDLGVFVPLDQVIPVLRAITDSWQENLRYRRSRAKARIKFMVDDYGAEGVRRMVEERLGYRLENYMAPLPEGEADHLGVHPQKQEGLVYVGVPVPMGWITAGQMVQIGDFVEDVGGDIRFTRQQNFIVGNVPEERLEWLLERLAHVGFPVDINPAYGTSIACTSHQFCNYSVAETKEKLKELLEVLDQRFGTRIRGLKIHMDGCPHACAHHWVGDIGLQGTVSRQPDGRLVEAYDITLRGGLGVRTAIGKPLIRRLPSAETTEAVVRLVDTWLREREQHNGQAEEFTFHEFCQAHTDEELKAIALGQEVPAPEAPKEEAIAIRIPGMLLYLTKGANIVEVRATTLREAIEEAGRQYPELKAHLVDERGEINATLNIYVDEEDVRFLRGLETPLKPGDKVLILPALAGG
ncbi:MAG: MoaD/ThiS family protein [Ardenticatenia bacterium]|nr:MoaD/ThiS family protein [Ardenticatenia bacterium]